MLIWYFSIDPVLYGYVGKCWNNVSMHYCFPIQGTNFVFLLKLYEARISEWNVCSTNQMQCYLTTDPYSVGRMCCRCDISSKVIVRGEEGGPVYRQEGGGRSWLYTGGRREALCGHSRPLPFFVHRREAIIPYFLPLYIYIYIQKGGTCISLL